MSRVSVKKEQPLVCFLRLYGPAKKRMLKMCERYSTKHNDVAMSGTLTELLRLENQADHFDPHIARALAELRSLSIDPLPHLQAIIADAAGVIRP